MKKVCFIQPLIASYCAPLFEELAEKYELTVIYSDVDISKGYGEGLPLQLKNVKLLNVATIKIFGEVVAMYQLNIIKYIRCEKPSAVIIFSNVRYASFWAVLVWCKIRNIPVYPHGQGLYRKKKVSIIWKIVYRVIALLSTKYICYTQSSANSLIEHNIPINKIAIADNSIENPSVVKPEDRSADKLGVLFIGRLRTGCKLDLLIDVVKDLRKQLNGNIVLHVVGDGENFHDYKQLAEGNEFLIFYGAVYNTSEISEISQNCVVGCYPGNAGLSVVHMMSLSLPMITHNDMALHQGPEPSYIVNGKNGVLFDITHPHDSLLCVLSAFFNMDDEEIKKMQKEAYTTYLNLTNPSLAKRFMNILDA